MPKDDTDYFTKLHKGTQPFRDLFSKKPEAPAKPVAPKAPSEESKRTVKSHELQGGVSMEDDAYIRSAGERAVKKLAPKSVMGKSSPKR